VPLALFVQDDSDEQSFGRKAQAFEITFFEEHVILTVTGVGGIFPAFGLTIELFIADRSNLAIDVGIDLREQVPPF